jgi:hypothetical protein
MSSANRTSPEPRHASRLPRPLWIGLAAVVLFVSTAGIRLGLPFYQKQSAFNEIDRLGGKLTTERIGSDSSMEHTGPVWQNLFRDPWRADLNYTRANDHTLYEVVRFRELESLWLTSTDVTDAGLVHISKLHNLSGLLLWDTRITDEGLAHLAGLRNLTVLDLDDTPISDAGLKEIECLANLRLLDVRGTRVTDAGIANLKQHLPRLEVRR